MGTSVLAMSRRSPVVCPTHRHDHLHPDDPRWSRPARRHGHCQWDGLQLPDGPGHPGWHLHLARALPGDANNNGAVDNGANEGVTTVKAAPAINTQASESNGGVVHRLPQRRRDVSWRVCPTHRHDHLHADARPTAPSCPSARSPSLGRLRTTPRPASSPLRLAPTPGTRLQGDANNNGAVDNGANEGVTTVKATPAIMTQAAESKVTWWHLGAERRRHAHRWLCPTRHDHLHSDHPNGAVLPKARSLSMGRVSTTPHQRARDPGWHLHLARDLRRGHATTNGADRQWRQRKREHRQGLARHQYPGARVQRRPGRTSMLSDVATLSGGLAPHRHDHLHAHDALRRRPARRHGPRQRDGVYSPAASARHSRSAPTPGMRSTRATRITMASHDNGVNEA